MTITITLPTDTEAKLRKRAAESGVAADALARDLIEQALNGDASDKTGSGQKRKTLSQILAPFRKEVDESGMTDEQLKDLFTQTRDEVRSEKRTARS